jgi:hypothetical protein
MIELLEKFAILNSWPYDRYKEASKQARFF